MRKLCLLILLVAFSCSDNNGDRYSFSFTEDSLLEIVQNEGSYMLWANVTNGDNLVFQYEFHAEDDENIADDEYSEFIKFELNPDLTEFEYDTTELSNIKLTLTQSCFCGFFDEEKDMPPVGTISGTKLSQNRWLINIDVTFYGDERRTISEIFSLKD